jgi:hypothetical protein
MLWHGVLSAAMGDRGGIDSPYLQRQGDVLILGNDHLARHVRLRDGVWQTVALHNRRTGHKRKVESPEFVLYLEDRQLSSADFRLTGLTQPPPDAAGRLCWTVQLAAPEAGLEAELLLTLHPDQFRMTKQLRRRAPGPPRAASASRCS